ncbi:MAG: chemotaxis protein CheA [Terracidiphilus sp.]
MDNLELFKKSFREEAREILVDLESALLELNERPGDDDLISRVFRGLHTLKGSGSMFGFDELAAFTHDLENAFDAVRNGRLEATGALIDLTLESLDQIRSLLEENAGNEPASDARRKELLVAVRGWIGTSKKSSTDGEGGEPIMPAEEESLPDGRPLREWRVEFAPGPDLLLNGTNPLLLLRELRQLGGVSLRANLSAVPSLVVLEPERCYVAWEIVLSTGAGLEAIRDVFIFVEDSCALKIEPLDSGTAVSVDVKMPPIKEGQTIPGVRRGQDPGNRATSLRVPAAKLDQLVDLVGELVTVQARLSELAVGRDDPEVTEVAEQVERLAASLRENSMNMRMVPIRATFERFRRLVHDLARDLGKSVELATEGAETELDKAVIECLSDPLMHLIRNSMDHGIERAEVRTAQGKNAKATIRLSARHAGASVLVEVADDGSGIDAEAVRLRAVEKGLVASDAPLDDAQIHALLFQPGFSTAKEVTEVSGRGVGMDVVRKSVESLRGMIDVASTRGRGTTVTLRLPLTLAIIDGLLVCAGGQKFVLPLANTLECIELTRDDVERAGGKHLAVVRGEVIPYIRLREYFGMGSEAPELEQIMVVETEGGPFGFAVDRVLGDCQTVIKNLGRFYRNVHVISGATILGNGSVALILDPERLAQDAVRGTSSRARGHPAARASRDRPVREKALADEKCSRIR